MEYQVFDGAESSAFGTHFWHFVRIFRATPQYAALFATKKNGICQTLEIPLGPELR